MADRVSDNLAMLMRVVDRLAPLQERLVFLGGAVTELFITLPGGQRPRQTKDVELVVDVVNLGEYSEILRGRLAALGLREDTREGAPICRWLFEDIASTSCRRGERFSGFHLSGIRLRTRRPHRSSCPIILLFAL